MDLHILPLHRREGKDLPSLPGLFVADSGITRRSTRSRKGDLLVLFLTLEGTATLAGEDQAGVLETLAEAYFESGGSVTTALRTAAEQMNDLLLERNREGATRNLQATGLFTALAIHNGQAYTLQCGPNHVFTVHAVASQTHHDPLLAGRGLGLGRSTAHFLNHAPLDAGDLIILATDPPSAWQTDSLKKAYSRPMSTIHRVLMSAAGTDVRAVILQVQRGKGNFKILQRDELSAAQEPVKKPAPARTAGGKPEREAPAPARTAGGKPEQETPVKAAAEGRVSGPLAASGEAHQATTSLSRPVRSAGPAAAEKPPSGRRAGQAFMAILRAFGGALKALWYSLRAVLARILPGSELFTIPPATMAFIAIAVPVLVVTVAGVVYVRRGQMGQYNTYVRKAGEVAVFAAGREDPNEARISWQAVLDYVDLAEAYQETEETQALRDQAYAAIDPLEGIERLDFQPALLTPLGEQVNIVRMVATRDELFLLDSNSGSVIRAWLSGRGFEIDTDFKCGSFGNSTYSIGRLIDLAPLPRNNSLGADLFAMDGNGNALYCTANGSPPVAQAVAPPNSNWGDPRSFVLDSGALYVLDPQTNAVWIYGGQDYAYITPPRLFFDDEVPQMQGVIDFSVDLDDLYMLYEDGHITTCTFGFAGQPTKCTDPAIFTDSRPGRENGASVAGAVFSQIRFSPPPDPSIYLLDSEAGAIYHYSLRLTFQRQFRPLAAPDGPSTAFAVSPGRMIFLAFGSDVFWALIP